MSINLANVPLPNVIVELDAEAILAEMRADLVARFPEIEPTLRLESALANKMLQVFAMRETLLRARINDAARGLMLASSTGADLENFVADFGLTRLVIGYDDKGEPIFETDDMLRARRNLAPDKYAAAGPENAYIFHALSANGTLRQVAAIKGEDNRCDVILLSRDGDGSVAPEVVAQVYEALSPKTTRPLTDNVYVRSVDVIVQPVVIRIRPHTGFDVATIRAGAQDAVERYAAQRAAIGKKLRIDGLLGAAHSGNGLESAEVLEPSADVDPGPFGSVFVPSVTIEVI